MVFLTPVLPLSFKLTFPCTNHIAEYEALILGLELASEMNVHDIDVFGDSQLIVRQIKGEYFVREPHLIPYHSKATRFMGIFYNITI